MKWLAGGLLIFSLILLGALGLGCLLPQTYVIESDMTVKLTPEETFQRLTDVDGFLTWRKGIKKVERLPAYLGREGWKESRLLGSTTVEVIEAKPSTSLVLRITETELPFRGVFRYELQPKDGGTSVKLRHEGDIPSPAMRLAFRLLGWRENLLQISLWELNSHE